MTEVDPQARARMKEGQRNAANFDSLVSGGLSVVGTFVSFVSPEHGAMLRIGGGMFAICAVYRRSLANDPPRDDYDSVWVSAGEVNQAMISPDVDLATLQRFVAHGVIVADASCALLYALERYDGALAADPPDQEAAEAQADAVGRNAVLAADHQDAMVALAPAVNALVAAGRAATERTWDSVELQEVKDAYIETCGADRSLVTGPQVSTLLSAVPGVAEDVLSAPADDATPHPILEATELPADRDAVVDDEWTGSIDELSAVLRELVG